MGLDIEANDPKELGQTNEFLKELNNLNQTQSTKEKDKTDIFYPLPEKFSFSQLAAFSTCPLQYKFAFVLKIPAPSDKASLIFGRVLHNTLNIFLTPLLSENKKIQASLFKEEKKQDISEIINEPRLLSLYKEYWQADGYKSKEEREEYYQKGIKALKNFLVDWQQNPPTEILFLEKNFSFKIDTDIIRGTIDRVDRLSDGTLEIIDYKTGQGKDKLEFKDKRQLVLYQIFLEDFLQEKVSKLTYYYLEAGEKLSFVANTKEIEKVKIGIREEIAAIKERNFVPKPSTLCKFCDFNQICEFRKN